MKIMQNISSIHSKHRERLKTKFILHGLDVFETHEILELILFYAIPRKDTNPMAHELLNQFGSIHGVFEAPINLLESVNGVGKETACFIKLLLNFVRIYMSSKNFEINKYNSREELNERIILQFIGRYDEFIAIILTDMKNKLVYEGIVSQGSCNSVEIHIRKIVELITLYNASGIVFAHNHPSGLAIPSREDIETTKQLQQIFKTMNVKFIDHVIVADSDYISLRECNIEGIFD